MMHECAVYHPASKTLQLTDTLISQEYTRTWVQAVYTVPLGIVRGKFTRALDPFSYQYLFVNNIHEFEKSIEKVMKLDIDNVVLGHGGIVQEGAKSHLANAWDIYLNPKSKLTTFEAVYYTTKWIWTYLARPHISSWF